LKLVCDEGVDRPIVEALREHGHDVSYIAELDPSLRDDAILALANDLGAPLITHDKDFGELVFRQRRTTAGVILLRIGGLQPEEKQRATLSVVDKHASEIVGSFTVVTPMKIRIRRPQ
jgi:predicted nuclease of predicted toxin-antitoxin system